MNMIMALPGNEAFAERLAAARGGVVTPLETRRFPDGESYVRVVADVAGRGVDLVATQADPDRGFLRLMFAARALRELGAASVNLIAPYLGYMRQDARFNPGEAETSRTFADLISGAFDQLVTVDPHLHRHPTLETIYAIPCLTLHAAPLMADWIRANVDAPLIVGPDVESAQWVSAIAARADAPYAVLTKQRLGDRDVRVSLPDLAAHRGRKAVVIDDIASSGRTLVAAAEALAKQDFTLPTCLVVHALFVGDAFEAVSAVMQQVVSTDSISHPSNTIGLAPLIAGAFG